MHFLTIYHVTRFPCATNAKWGSSPEAGFQDCVKSSVSLTVDDGANLKAGKVCFIGFRYFTPWLFCPIYACVGAIQHG